MKTKFYLFYLWRIPLLLLLIPYPEKVLAQCNNWTPSTSLIGGSNCAASAAFNVSLNGPDATNLTNLQYAIPIAANGFSVPLNSSNGFSNIPAGSYTVTVLASCGGNIVGKNTSVIIPGTYQYPQIIVAADRQSLSCNNSGRISVTISKGVAPFTITIVNAPANYTGPTIFTSSTTSKALSNLAAGSYSIQVHDACNNGAFANNVVVGSLNLATLAASLSFITVDFSGSGCDTLNFGMPYINITNGWIGYAYDTTFQIAAQIGNGVSVITPFRKMDGTGFSVPLLPGKSLKDCYGQIITYTIHPPCGTDIQVIYAIPYPSVSNTISQQCNVSFTDQMSLPPILCLPITYYLHDSANTSYGPYTTSGNITTPSFPLGTYTMTYTTADGYTGSNTFGASNTGANPYSISISNGANGLQNYIRGFIFHASYNGAIPTIELFSGPAGYSYSATTYSGNTWEINENQTPTGTGNILFKAGNYVWKIMDNCGTYYVPITVGPQDLFQFTAGIDHEKRTCDGLWVWPTGTATNNSTAIPVQFYVVENADSILMNQGNLSYSYTSVGDSFLLTTPGNYAIYPTANGIYFDDDDNIEFGQPAPYINTFSFVDTFTTVRIDINHTQGFLCKGDGAGQGKIDATGMGGIPFATPAAHYNFKLAHLGQGASGPYIATNTTGIFTGFAANANDIFDVRIEDSCGSFSVQSIKILDLNYARLISSSNYILCNATNVQLGAIYLPNATYYWTGPNGFTSTLQNPFITNISNQFTGVYHVAITTTACSQTITDSTILIIVGNPPKPLISANCTPPASISITNPSTGYSYLWSVNFYPPYLASFYYNTTLYHSDSNYLIHISPYRSYSAFAIDSTTGCKTYSDSLYFGFYPNDTFAVGIYSPHLKLCTGDTTIMVATINSATQNTYNSPFNTFQWFKNGILLPGATNSSYATAVAGAYKVAINAGPCSQDTSDEAIVTVVPIPTATLAAASLSLCTGDTVLLQANIGTGYSYTWHLNGATVYGAFGQSLSAIQGGDYYVTVSNGGCVRNSDSIMIIEFSPPVVHLLPDANQFICPGNMVQFATQNNAAYSYEWFRNNALINGATTSNYNTTAAGIYQVVAKTPQCNAVHSNPVTVTILPNTLSLGNDTVICTPGAFSISLSVAAGFTSVLWSTGATTNQIFITAPGTYRVAATDNCGTLRDTFVVHSIEEYTPSLPRDTMLCDESPEVRFKVPALWQNVQWSNGATANAISITRPGDYWVQGQTPCGIMHDTVTVAFCAPIIQSISISKQAICVGDCIQLSATVANYPDHFFWNLQGGKPDTSADASPQQICYANAGNYPITLIIISPGGADTFSSQVTVFAKPVPLFKDTAFTVAYKSSFTFPTCAEGRTVDWYKDGQLICASCNSLTIDARYYQNIYHCVVSNGDCKDSCSYQLSVIDIPNDVWLPDAFSPNGDGLNDIFHIITDNPNVLVDNLSVYNRWGQRVFTSNLNNDGWNGTFGGKPADIGTYFWKMKYQILGTNQYFERKGDLVLVR